MPRIIHDSSILSNLDLNLDFLESADISGNHPTSVKHYSPFRYPGGKSWLSPQVSLWLQHKDYDQLVEPYAGGASVGLFALIEGYVDNIIINEIDPSIHNFWHVLKYNHSELTELIRGFVADEETTRKIIADLKSKRAGKLGDPEWAFHTLLRNRLARNGVMTSRSGILKLGDRGLFSRWYPDTLVKRIEVIAKFADAISLTKIDGIDLIRRKSGTCYFVDPPYSVAGKKLYTYNLVDHDKLLKQLSNLSSDVLVTYDSHIYIAGLIAKHGLCFTRVSMMSGGNSKKIELLISKDLGWLQRSRDD